MLKGNSLLAEFVMLFDGDVSIYLLDIKLFVTPQALLKTYYQFVY